MDTPTQEQSFEEAIKAHLIENRQRLVEQAVKHAITNMAESMKYSAYEVSGRQLKEFFEKEVSPAIIAYMETQKESIIATMLATIKNVIDTGMKAQGEEWLKAMSEGSYKRREVFEKIFGASKY